MSSWTQFNDRNVMRAEEVQHRFGRKLKWCPFCKSLHVGLYMGPHPHVTCLACGADGPLSKRVGPEDYYHRHITAVERWNLAA
jgi:hypothetical protein